MTLATVIRVGTSTCGLASGAGKAMQALSAEGAKVKSVGCMGLCFLEPIAEVAKDGYPPVLYGKVDEAKARAIAAAAEKGEIAAGAFAVRGQRGQWKNSANVPILEELSLWKKQERRVISNCGTIDPESIDDYIAAGGYEGLKKALKMRPEQVIAEVLKSGLRGRGGAGFPAGKKWELARAAPGDKKFAVCNADEGDPGAFMNRAMLEGDPHRVLEGLMISAYAIGADEGYVFVRAEKRLAAQRIQQAVEAAKKAGLLGRNILGSGFSLDVDVALSAGAFVCGEETALIHAIEGKRGMPRDRPPFPAQSGIMGKPTNINTVETLAHAAMILAKGADWFAQVGSEKSKGTKIFCLSGKVNNTGSFEVPLGTKIRDVLFDIGGGIPDGKQFKAVQTGGPSGGCLTAEELDLPLDYETLQSAGSIMGSGGLVVFDSDSCAVDSAKFFLSFTKAESCGKCVPCREGTMRLYEMLDKLSTGKGSEADLEKIGTLGALMRDAALCGLGQSAPNPVVSLLKKFNPEFVAHARLKTCAKKVCPMK